MKPIYIILSVFLLTITMVTAYNTADIISYYDFYTGNLTNFTNLAGGENLYVSNSSGYSIGTGSAIADGSYLITGNAIGKAYYTANTTSFYHNSFSINFWFKNVGTTNTERYFLTTKSLSTNGSIYYWAHMSAKPEFKNGYGTILSSPQINVDSTWRMITITYNYFTSQMKMYVNGAEVNSTFTNLSDMTPNASVLYFQDYADNGIDELSIWDTTLSDIDVALLYNAGNGQSYNSTNQSEVTIPTSEWLNICIPTQLGTNVLCHHLYYNTSVGLFCPIAQQEVCPITCSDNQSYWSALNQSPIDMDYNGTCSASYFQCQVIGSLRCGTPYIVQKCTVDSIGNRLWSYFEFCGAGKQCVNGVCELVGNGTSPTGNAVDDFLSGAGLSNGTKYLIVLFTIMVIFGGFVVVGFSTGTMRGSTIMGIIVSCFAFIAFTLMGWIPAWVIIMMIIIGVASGILIGRSAQGNSGAG